ncbi:MAG: hypothetical protein VYA55_01095 [Pseudomonadota bacterium]|nr:hypothetical protein [Pseudomonadota bacterium]
MRYQRAQRLALADWFVIGLTGYGGLVALLFVIASVSVERSVALDLIADSPIAWAYPIFCGLAIVGVWLAIWLFTGSEREIANLNTPGRHKLKVNPKLIARVTLLGWAALILGAASYWLYARSYGGFSNLLQYSAGIRAGLVDVDDNAYTFLKRFGGFCFLASLLFGGALLSRGKSTVMWLQSCVGFIVSFLASLFILYSWEGRLGLVTFALVVPFGYLVHRHGVGIKLLRNAAILSLIPLFALPASSALWGKSAESDNISSFFIRELSFPLNSFSQAYENNSIRYMKDVLAAPLFLLPTRVWKGMLGLDTASDVNTENVMGKRKGQRGSTTAVPIDFITFCYMQASFLGMLLVGFIFGALLCILDRFLMKRFEGAVYAMLYSYSVLFVSGMSALYADPKHILNRNFHFVVGLFLLWWLCKSIKLNRDEPAQAGRKSRVEHADSVFTGMVAIGVDTVGLTAKGEITTGFGNAECPESAKFRFV